MRRGVALVAALLAALLAVALAGCSTPVSDAGQPDPTLPATPVSPEDPDDEGGPLDELLGEDGGPAVDPRAAEAVPLVRQYVADLAAGDAAAALAVLSPASVELAGGEEAALAQLASVGAEVAPLVDDPDVAWASFPTAEGVATVVTATGAVPVDGAVAEGAPGGTVPEELVARAWVVRGSPGELVVDDVLPEAVTTAAGGRGFWDTPLTGPVWRALLPDTAVNAVTAGAGFRPFEPERSTDLWLAQPVPGAQAVTIAWTSLETPLWRTASAVVG